MVVTVIPIWGVPTKFFNTGDSNLNKGVSLSFSLCVQSTTNVAVGSTTVMRMPSAPTLSEDTAAPANRAMWGTGPSAEVGLLPWENAVSCHPAWALGTHVRMLSSLWHSQGSFSWFISWKGHWASKERRHALSVPFGLTERGMCAGQGHGPTIGWLFSFASGPELVKNALIAAIPCEALLREQVGTACGHT